MRVDITTTNAAGIGTGAVTLKLQCRRCDHHVGTEHDEDWVTVADDYNQSLIYAQAGITAAVNNPEASPEGVAWRAVVSQGTAITRMDVDFTSGPATTDGNTEGDPPPVLTAYNVANTDFFTELNRFIPAAADRFRTIDPRSVISGAQTLAGLQSLVLADEAFPGYTRLYAGELARPSGPATGGFAMASERPTSPGLGVHSEASSEKRSFTVGPNDGNASMTVEISWPSGVNDFDLYLYRVENGMEVFVDDSAGGPPGTSEQIEVREPPAGDYVVEVLNYAATDPQWTGSVSFTPFEAVAASTVTVAEKDAWMAALRQWVSTGGQLVLTDGALRALGELTPVPGDAVRKQTVYVGQVTFSTGTGDTLSDALNEGVADQGARFNTGMRRQLFEPTPLGFAIQNPAGADASFARQYDIDRTAFEAAGGRIAATSANSGARNAAPMHSRVAYGEIPVGQGTVRVLGALLPQPTQAYDHQLGIEPYSVTYTDYVLMRNLLEQ